MSAPSELVTDRDEEEEHHEHSGAAAAAEGDDKASASSSSSASSSGVHEEDPKTEAEVHAPEGVFMLPKQNAGFQYPYYLLTERALSKVRPPAVVKTLEQRKAEFSAEQLETLDKFRAMVEAAAWYDASMIDDWVLLRYLKARSFSLDKSFKMLEKSIQWRKETGCDTWQCDACLKDPNQHFSYFVGWDLQHRPVLAMSMRWGPERTNPLRHMVCVFNHLVRMMPVGVEQWVCITDFETYSHMRDSRPSMGIGVINTIQDHYPERLGKMICINPPTMFWVLWKCFSPVIDPVTKTKVEFLYTEDKPSVYDSFPKLFPPHLCHYLFDLYHRSHNKLPAEPLVWRPKPGGYPDDWEERKTELKDGKLEKKKEKKEKKAAEKKKEDTEKQSQSTTAAAPTPAAPEEQSVASRSVPKHTDPHNASGEALTSKSGDRSSKSRKDAKKEEKEAKKEAKREEKEAKKEAKEAKKAEKKK